MEISELKQKRKEFLDDTWQYYAEDISRRAVEGIIGNVAKSSCKYKTSDGRKCSIGRHIPDDVYDPIIEGNSIIGGMVTKRIPSNILELGIEFLQEIQQLHDCDDNWYKLGLSSLGEENVGRIMDIYCL